MRAVIATALILALVCLAGARPVLEGRTLKDGGAKKKGGCKGGKKCTDEDKEFSIALIKAEASGFALSTADAEADANNDDDADAHAETSGGTLLGSSSGKAFAFDTNEGHKAITVATHETKGFLTKASSESTAVADDDDTMSESSAKAAVIGKGKASAKTFGAATNEAGEFAITAAQVDVEGRGFGEASSSADDDDTSASGIAVSKGGHVTAKAIALQRDGIV